MTIEQLRQVIAEVAEELGTKLKLYYIGNCSSYLDPSKPRFYPGNYDDRSWAICFEALKTYDRRHYAPHNFVLGETEAWQHLEPETLRVSLRGRFASLTAAAA